MRRILLAALVVGLGVVAPSVAAGGPTGSYSGTAPPWRGTGGAHHVSFAVKGGVLTSLQIGPGKVYCHPPNESGLPGSSPSFFLASESALGGFPPLKVFTSGTSYEVSVTLQRSGSSWKPHRGVLLVNGPMYLEVQGYFTGSRFAAASADTPNLQLSFGADAKGKPNPHGPLECNFESILVANSH